MQRLLNARGIHVQILVGLHYRQPPVRRPHSATYARRRRDETRAAPIPNFGPDTTTAWTLNRPAHDDFLPPPSGPGPVTYDKAHPYVPNGQGQPTYRVADLTNPILKPWVIERMRKANEGVLAGKIPFIARERCWPAGVPGLDIYNRGQPVHFIQTPKMVVYINELYAQMRHIYLDVAAFGAGDAVMARRVCGALRR